MIINNIIDTENRKAKPKRELKLPNYFDEVDITDCLPIVFSELLESYSR